MTDRKTYRTILVALAIALPAAAQASGDPGKGEQVFKEQCSECHSAEVGHNRKGPSLYGVVGRNPGATPDYAYSDAMKANPEPWNEARLDAYVAHPKRVVPGGKMKYDGLDEAGERTNLIAYLATLR